MRQEQEAQEPRGGLKRPMHLFLTLITAAALLACSASALAQADAPANEAASAATSASPDDTSGPETEEDLPVDGLGRDTPLSSIRGFVAAAEAFDWALAERYLDLRNLPPQVRRVSGEELAEQLYFILQRRQLEVDPELISDDREGHQNDELPGFRDHLGQIASQEGPVPLLMQHVPGPDGALIWKLSNQTVARIPDLYKEFSYPDWVERIRSAVPGGQSFLGLELFKWVILLGALLVLLPLCWIVCYALARLIGSAMPQLRPEIRQLMTGPVLALLVISILGQLIYELGVGATAARILGAHTLPTIFTVWLVWKVVDFWRARRRIRYEQEGRSDAAVLGRPVANAIKLVVLLLGLLVWLANAGVDISALLAGLGIGGIAVALALQKPIEDLFGAVSIYSQRPVATGDLCRYGDSLGVVEEIGLRTTRIRTLSNTLVNVPNAQLSTGVIENLTARTKIMYQPDLPLRYDTSKSQLQALLPALEDMLRQQPMVEEETIRVRLREFGQNAIMVRVRIFALTQSIEEYLSMVQNINLEIMDIMQQHGVSFSQGAQTLFIKRGDGSNAAAADTRQA